MELVREGRLEPLRDCGCGPVCESCVKLLRECGTWAESVTPLSSYEIYRDVRSAENEAAQRALNLAPRTPPKRKAVKRKKAAPSAPPRRSTRTRAAVDYAKERVDASMEEAAPDRTLLPVYDTDDDDGSAAPPRAASVRRVVRAKRPSNEKLALSDEKRAAIAGKFGDWVKLFEEWLRAGDAAQGVNPASQANVDKTVRQVALFRSGAGVEYERWRGEIFMVGEKLDLASNCKALFDRAVDFEATTYTLKNGEVATYKDAGNGWRLQHPLKKLMHFQVHLARQL